MDVHLVEETHGNRSPVNKESPEQQQRAYGSGFGGWAGCASSRSIPVNGRLSRLASSESTLTLITSAARSQRAAEGESSRVELCRRASSAVQP